MGGVKLRPVKVPLHQGEVQLPPAQFAQQLLCIAHLHTHIRPGMFQQVRAQRTGNQKLAHRHGHSKAQRQFSVYPCTQPFPQQQLVVAHGGGCPAQYLPLGRQV
ncbi:hypothetical protein SDC9_167540 [bioreactor metagenome]|uniref:Uncharacterized protein n=1 Tax=bioreactor metagenome TaxID=1076179 RepID=A0A645G8B6_9ZZZZ